MLSLQLFGTCTLRSDGVPLSGPVAQRRRLALLTLIASARSRGLSRDKITACFWPDEDRERGRHFLADSLFTIRKAVGKHVLLTTGDDISLNPQLIDVDVLKFEAAVKRGDFPSAISLYGGPFLDGFLISDAPDFDRWADSERERLSSIYGTCLEHVAQAHEDRGDYAQAAATWKRLASHDAYSARIALRTMRALDRSGDSTAAVQHAAKYQKLIHDDLDLPPDPEIAGLANTLRSSSASRTSARRFTDPPPSSSPTTAGLADPPVPAIESPLATRSSADSRKLRMPWQKRPRAFATGVLVVAASIGILTEPSRLKQIRPLSARPVQSASALETGNGKLQLTARQESEDLYSQGRYLTQGLQDANRYPQALALYQKAVDRDPTFAKAYAGMADVYNYMGDSRRAKESALKALSVDSTMAEAFNALAYVYAYYDHRWLAADSAVERATRLKPRFTLAHLRRANINAALGRADIAFASLEKARAIEPESWTVLYNRGAVAVALGMTADAIKYFEAALALEPNRKDVQIQLAWNYWAAGRRDEAVALLRSIGDVTDAAILSGDTSALRLLIKRFETDTTALTWCQAAMIYAQLGDKDASFRQLRREAATNRLMPLFMRSPPLVWLKDDPRYGELMSELGLQ